MTDDVSIEQILLPGVEPAEDVATLALRPESQWFERKSGRINARDLADVLVGFANAEGGTVVVGVADDGSIEGIAASGKVNGWRQAARNFTEPPIRHRFRVIPCINGGGHDDELAIIEVELSEQVHTNSRGETFLRIGDATHRLGPAEARELGYDKGEATFDGRPSGLTAENLSERLVEVYARAAGASNPTNALVSRGLTTEQDGGVTPTVAGLLLLGVEPQRYHPEACVRILRHEGTRLETGARSNIVADRRIEGPLTHQIEEAQAAIREWLPQAIRLGESGRFSSTTIIPEAAWLEAVVNAITHRSYSLGGDHIRVSLFRDRIEVESPGRLPGLVRTENIRRTRFARNPRIARALSDLGYGRELGEGVDRMFEEMARAGLPEPLYEQGPASVRVTLRADPTGARMLEVLPAGSGRFVEHVTQRGRVTTSEAVDLLGRARPTALRYLRRLENAGFLERVGSTYDPTAYWRLLQ